MRGQHAGALAADLGIEDGQLAEVALRYVLSRAIVARHRWERNFYRP